MDAESLTLLISSSSEVAIWDSVLTNKGPATQPQAPERWARSLSRVRRGTEPGSCGEGQRRRACSETPRSPHSSDKRRCRRRRAFQQMVSIQGAAAEMLTSRKHRGCDPSDDSISCSRRLGRDSWYEEHLLAVKIYWSLCLTRSERLKRWESLSFKDTGWALSDILPASLCCCKCLQRLINTGGEERVDL